MPSHSILFIHQQQQHVPILSLLFASSRTTFPFHPSHSPAAALLFSTPPAAAKCKNMTPSINTSP
eukprot:scaffold266518_cov13-Tisochrysis_lutea.AAC.1